MLSEYSAVCKSCKQISLMTQDLLKDEPLPVLFCDDSQLQQAFQSIPISINSHNRQLCRNQSSAEYGAVGIQLKSHGIQPFNQPIINQLNTPKSQLSTPNPKS
uniref:Uncharacterized protein n=1 Tax=Opuntia streptacantha TaxID=393608 RepID=A0A7C9DCZ6_OPUST